MGVKVLTRWPACQARDLTHQKCQRPPGFPGASIAKLVKLGA